MKNPSAAKSILSNSRFQGNGAFPECKFSWLKCIFLFYFILILGRRLTDAFEVALSEADSCWKDTWCGRNLCKPIDSWRKLFNLGTSCNWYVWKRISLMLYGLWWWPSGQRHHLLPRRSKFESCWLLKYSVQKDKTKCKRGRGWPILKKFLGLARIRIGDCLRAPSSAGKGCTLEYRLCSKACRQI